MTVVDTARSETLTTTTGGWVGPYQTEEDALAACGSSSSSSLNPVCRSDLTTLYVTYSCAPNCDAQNVTMTFTLLDPSGWPPNGYAWAAGSNPTGCDNVDVITCIEGTWRFISCDGSGYANPPGIPVNVISYDPLYIELGPWDHQSVNLCAYPDIASCTATITE